MRVSSRLPSRFEPNALTLAVDALKCRNAEILDLTVSNPIAAGLRFPAEALQRALGGAGASGYFPDPMGSREAREAVAAWHGHGVRAEEVLLTASTSEAYSWLFKLLCDPGDEVLVPSPSYPLFDWLARLEGVSARSVPAYFHERWHLDLGALEQGIQDRTRAVVMVNPNNPTGHFLARSQWRDLTELCARRGLALLVDEVFSDYALETSEDRLPTVLADADPPCPVFVLSGLSKIAALPQVKLGWILARGARTRELISPLAFLADQYLSVSASAQIAAPELLRLAPAMQARILGRCRANLETLDACLEEHPHLSRLPVEGGWTALLRRPAVDSDEDCVLRILRDARVLVHPGHFFDLPGDGHLVLSLLTEENIFREGLRKALPAINGPLS
jgi:aspartate/methionine/tyrosine aminotransferase